MKGMKKTINKSVLGMLEVYVFSLVSGPSQLTRHIVWRRRRRL